MWQNTNHQPRFHKIFKIKNGPVSKNQTLDWVPSRVLRSGVARSRGPGDMPCATSKANPEVPRGAHFS